MVGTITDEASLSLLDHQQIVETITTSLQTTDNEEQQAKVNKGNNKITEHRAIFQTESQNS